MLASRFYAVKQPLVLESIPDPEPLDGEVLIRVKACGICGSDHHILYHGITQTAYTPITLGHEVAGDVVCLGPGVASEWTSRRVAVIPDLHCGKCVNCVSGKTELCIHRTMIGIHVDGGLAEYVKVPVVNCVPIPDGVPYDIAAVTTDAVATSYHALLRVANLSEGQTIAILGTGALAYHAVKIARMLGASHIINVGNHTESLERARRVGADDVTRWKDWDPSWDHYRRAVDVVVDFSGTPEMTNLALKLVRVGGRVVLVGLGDAHIHLPINSLVRAGIQIMGSYGANLQDMTELFQYISTGQLDLSESVSKTYFLPEINEAFQHSKEKRGNPVRIVITAQV